MKLVRDVHITDKLCKKKFTCDLKKCKGMCCVIGDLGAPVTTEDVVRIERAIPKILAKFSRGDKSLLTTGRWFRGHAPDNFSITDHLKEPGCIFVYHDESEGVYHCRLHELALHEGVPVGTYKPEWCHLFPLILYRFPAKRLTFDEREECFSCGDEKAIYNGKAAIEEVFGGGFFQELESLICPKNQ